MIKLYLTVEQARTIRDMIYKIEKDIENKLEKEVHAKPIIEIVEANLQQNRMLISLLNSEIERES